jgi:hypothetical protein
MRRKSLLLRIIMVFAVLAGLGGSHGRRNDRLPRGPPTAATSSGR